MAFQIPFFTVGMKEQNARRVAPNKPVDGSQTISGGTAWILDLTPYRCITTKGNHARNAGTPRIITLMCVFDVGSRWDLANENVTCQDLGCARFAQHNHRENDTPRLANGPETQQRLRLLVARRGAQLKGGHPQGGERQSNPSSFQCCP